jgi:hypothetical protein
MPLSNKLLIATLGGLLYTSTLSHALDIGPAEFRAAKQTACVMAQESLGYLSGDEYELLLEDVLEEFDDGERDTIFAKALGYYDGLMFSIPADNASMIQERLVGYITSDYCSTLRGYAATAMPQI